MTSKMMNARGRRLPALAVVLTFAASCNLNLVESFITVQVHSHNKRSSESLSSSWLEMAGKGMGMGGGVAAKKRNKKGGKKGKSGGSSSKPAPFDAAASLLRNERIYDEIVKEAYKEMESDYDNFDSITTEYVIAARSSASSGTSDWVPVAQVVVVRPVSDEQVHDKEHKETIRAAVSELCRESYFAATQAAPIFKQIPRNEVEYSAEPVDSFYRYVYDDVVEGKSSTGTSGAKGDIAMTKAEARKVLELEEGFADIKDIKSAYRRQLSILHPDRFIGVERSEEEKIQSSKEFAQVKIAYEVLTSGVRNGVSDSNGKKSSWYESLGGRQRMEFYGPIELLPVSAAKKTLEGLACRSSVCGLTSELSMTFVARNQAAAASKSATTK